MFRAELVSADTTASSGDDIELTILMPCLNEAETVATCVGKARQFLDDHGVLGEVLVADNGSTDGSGDLAIKAGARVVTVPESGYGNTLMGGIGDARGRYVIMGDADDSYDFLALQPFLDDLRAGADLVMGNRFAGGIAPGAMPALHRYLGNPVLSFIGRLFFGSELGDFHCGMRGFSRESVLALDLQASGMEFASEMVVKATLARQRISEVPTTLSPDGRSRSPHLRSWRDGWRHLRFLLLYSPRWLFLYPGLLLAFCGLVLGTLVTVHRNGFTVGSLNLDVDSLVACAGIFVVGYQAAIFAVLTTIYASTEGFLPAGPWSRRAQGLRLEWGLLFSAILLLVGVVGMAASLLHWQGAGYHSLNYQQELRLVVPSVTAFVVSMQTAAASLFISILAIRHGPRRVESRSYKSAAMAEPPR
jgi:hypothetical protein